MGELNENNSDKINKSKNNIGDSSKTKLELIEIGTDYSYKHEVVWSNAFGYLVLHLLAIWGLGVLLSGGVSLKTFLWIFLVGEFSALSITTGAHRLYAHKAYKAKPLLRAILIFAFTIAGQMSAYKWIREHRLHHRHSDTDADPHNAKRGFFFSHVGWLICKKHPYVIEFGRQIDMSDIEADWMIMFQFKYYYFIYFIFAFLIPVWVPVHYFGETWLNSFLVAYVLRWVLLLNFTWLVNSAAHVYGTRPYDKNLLPGENWLIALATNGEGWHNYHHTYPWDYRTSEFGAPVNLTTHIIDFFAKLGLAYDLKSASEDLVMKRILRTGDGTHWKLNSKDKIDTVLANGGIHEED